MTKKYVIIGTSAAGISALRTLCMYQKEPASITCISQELEKPYNKCFLVDYIIGSKTKDALLLSYPAGNHDVQWLFNTQVTAIKSNEKKISLNGDASISYDSLLLAVGSSPIIPPIAGLAHGNGVFFFHTLHDVTVMQDYIQENKVTSVVIIGSGITGLECADALYKNNLTITVIERSKSLLSSMLDYSSAAFFAEKLKKSGLVIRVNEEVVNIVYKNNKVASVVLATGEIISTDMVICATGVKANVALAVDAHLAIDAKGGVTVDACMQTSDRSIWAAGDVIVTKDALSGNIMRSTMWPDAVHQGMIAAHNMMGTAKTYAGIVPAVVSHVMDMPFVLCGLFPKYYDDQASCVIIETEEYRHVFYIQENLLKGFALIGNTNNYGLYKRLLVTKEVIDPLTMAIR